MEKAETVEDENEHGEEERDGKRLRIEEGELSEKEEKEQQEAKKIRIEEGELSDEGLLRAVRSLSSSSLSSVELESEIEAAPSPPKKNNTVAATIKMMENVALRIDSCLGGLSRGCSVGFLLSCCFTSSNFSLLRYCMRWGLLPPKKPRECAWKKLYIQYDHLEFPGVVPRTFIGALSVSILASPFVLAASLLHLPKIYSLYAG